MASRQNGKHATLYDFRDLDLMLKIEAEGNPEGWIEAADLASGLGFGEETTPIARRLSWMRHYGMLEYSTEHRMWRLSAGGRRVSEARLRAAHARQLDALPDESMVEVMAHIVGRHRLDPMTGALLRREFLYGTKQRG